MKTNILKLVVVGLLGMLVLTGCGPSIFTFYPGPAMRIIGSHHVVTESRNVSEFNGLVLNGAGRVFIDQTGTESLQITTDDNWLPYVVTEVRDGKLIIGFKPNVASRDLQELTFRLTVKNLNLINVNGAATVEGNGMKASQMTVDVDGAGAIKLAGQVDQLDVTLNGAGAFNSENLECKSARITNNGAGAATVRASDRLYATINGIGAIRYVGNPQVSRSVHGLGVITRR